MALTRLYIEGQEVELDKSVQFAITRQFEDISNPTVIINDWSKTVEIPFSENNNKLFGHIYCSDRIIVDGGSVNAGIYFDASKKLDFRLDYGDNVLLDGYAKMTEIKQTNGKGVYCLTLNGTLGKIFQEMKKITFDTSSTDTTYIISGSTYVEETINRNLIYDIWNNTNKNSLVVLKKSDSGYDVKNIIGFAPFNGFSNGFDFCTKQINSFNSIDLKTWLDENLNFTANGIKAESVIPNGLKPREMNEFRSYLQIPYIYVNQLFGIVENKLQEKTGYTFEKDSYWFNVNNPYWSKIVMIANKMKIEDKEDGSDALTCNNGTTLFNTTYNKSGSIWSPTLRSYQSQGNLYPTVAGTLDIADVTNRRFKIKKESNVNLDITTGLKFSFTLDNSYSGVNVTFSNLTSIFVIYDIMRPNGTIAKTIYFKIKGANNDEDDEELTNLKRILVTNNMYVNYTHKGGATWNVNVKELIKYADINGDYFTIRVRYRIGSNSDNVEQTNPLKLDNTTNTTVNATQLKLEGTTNSNVVCSLSDSKRSYSYFNLNDLWNNDFKPFDIIMNYCKMFRICVIADTIHKKIKFIPFNTYFSNYEVLDWTDKLDKSKSYSIKPIAFDSKYVLFNTEDNDTKINAKYKSKYGINYGNKKMITNYNFNNDTKSLFEGIPTSIIASDSVLSQYNLGSGKILYTLPQDIYAHTKDEDEKYVDIFGSFYFVENAVNFSTTGMGSNNYTMISDDSSYQTSLKKYFYEQNNASTSKYTTKYSKLTLVNDGNMLLFNTPAENYTYIKNFYNNGNSIFYNFWQQYINERYSKQNKIVTCYLNITPLDYMNFDFNKFIQIENQIYTINKIYDFDISNNDTTKVELITVQNINGYTTNNFHYTVPHLNVTPSEVRFDALEGGEFDAIIYSTSPWTLDLSRAHPAQVSEESGSVGTTTISVGCTSDYEDTYYIDFSNTEGYTTSLKIVYYNEH